MKKPIEAAKPLTDLQRLRYLCDVKMSADGIDAATFGAHLLAPLRKRRLIVDELLGAWQAHVASCQVTTFDKKKTKKPLRKANKK